MVTIKPPIHYFYSITTLVTFKETIITLTNRFDKIGQYVFLTILLLSSFGIGICGFLYKEPVLYSICVFVFFVTFFNGPPTSDIDNIQVKLSTEIRLRIQNFAENNTIWFLLIIISIMALCAFLEKYLQREMLILMTGLSILILLYTEGLIDTVQYVIIEKICRLSLEEGTSTWKVILYGILYLILGYIIGWLIVEYLQFCMIFLIAIVCSSNTIFLFNYLTPNYMKELDFDKTKNTASLNLDIPNWGMWIYMCAFVIALMWVWYIAYIIEQVEIELEKELEKNTPKEI